MKIEIWNNESAVLLTRPGGESLKVSIMEFWEICRYGARLDVKQEIDDYLSDNVECEGVDADVIRGSESFLDEVIDRVLDNRASKENSEQIYDAISHCLKYGKNKDELHMEKPLSDMDVEDFKDPERRKAFNGFVHAYRDLKRRMHEQNGMPFGGDRHMQDFLKMRLGDVTRSMDLLRVKEWLSQQTDDLDTDSLQYHEAMEMMEEVCEWAFPELAGMVFDGEDNDLIFREPHDSGLYVWAYFNPDANAGGQIVENSFGAADATRIAEAAAPAEVIDTNHTYHSDVNRKEFFMTIFDMLKMKEDGYYLGNNIKEVCNEILNMNQIDSIILNAIERTEEASVRGDSSEIVLE